MSSAMATFCSTSSTDVPFALMRRGSRRTSSCTIERRQAERRLVEQQQPRLRHQRAADRDHLLLAARQLAGRAASSLSAQRREQREHARSSVRAPLCRARGR